MAMISSISISPTLNRRCSSAELSHNPKFQFLGIRFSLHIQLRNSRCVHRRNYFKILCHRKGEIPTLKGRCMDEIYNVLADRVITAFTDSSKQGTKFLVGLAGPPGSGKTTLAFEVVRRINDSLGAVSDTAVVIPMDGFHMYRSQLDAMEDPKEAHARRGAPWTFDPFRLLKQLKLLKNRDGPIPTRPVNIGPWATHLSAADFIMYNKSVCLNFDKVKFTGICFYALL